MSNKTKVNISIFKRLLQYAKSYKKSLGLALFCTILLALSGPTRPLFIGHFIVQKYIISTQDSSKLLFWCSILIIWLILEYILQFVATYLSNLVAQGIILTIRKNLFKHLSNFKMHYFDKTPIGTIVTRLVSDLEAITDVFASGLIEILGDLISLVFIILIMLFVNWKLTLLTLIPIPLLIIATKIFAKAMQRSFQLESKQVTKLNTFVQERLTGMAIVQLFSRQNQEFEAFKEINKGHRQAHINAVWAFSIFFPLVEILSSISVAFLLVFIAFQIDGVAPENPQSKYVEVIEFTFWINMLFRPIRQLADKFNVLQRGVVRAERVFEVLDLQDNIQDNGTNTVCEFDQIIQFKNVYFAYQQEEWVLKNINLTIDKGETVAFVGATGSGKSSIVNLLGRFYEFQKGDIFIGNFNVKDIELSYLRNNIAIVLQDVFLFSDTIHNNITLGNNEISREQVINASKAVGAHEFIEKLPGQYDYNIGERGGVLSSGQRQILAFIRAYVYNPTILILDEATSSIDNESELMIQKATEKLTKGRTSIVIAHRLSTIQSANKIVVLDKGEIIEQGSHTELLQMNGAYNRLYEKQFTEHK
ncbi:MAG: ABC transporter ATP-binding protein [Flavobacteriia bacterium]|nr:ABC transporter ATP-binding protein [Flavobacteriia bacterium]